MAKSSFSFSKYEKLIQDIFPHPKENGEEYRQLAVKKLLALEIIKNKEINIHALLLHLKRFDLPSGYNTLVGEKYKLTQEEYDLLKEVL